LSTIEFAAVFPNRPILERSGWSNTDLENKLVNPNFSSVEVDHGTIAP
jgi:hypothetical protein